MKTRIRVACIELCNERCRQPKPHEPEGEIDQITLPEELHQRVALTVLARFQFQIWFQCKSLGYCMR
jgi:hypothetical protein